MPARLWRLCLLAWPAVEAIRLGSTQGSSTSDYGLPACMEERLRKVKMEPYGSERDPTLREAGLSAIFIAHWKALPQRRNHSEKQLDGAGLAANFITGYDGEELKDEDVRCLYPDNHVMHYLTGVYDFGANWMHTGELSLSLKHVKAAYEAATHGYEHTLVLEDDFAFTENFTTGLARLLSRPEEWLPKNESYDILWIGSYAHNHQQDIDRGPVTYRDRTNKGTVGYVLSLSGAKYLLSHMPINAPSDHMLGNDYTGTAPPNRWIHRPFLIEPKDDFGTVKGLATPKKSHFIRTPDIKSCYGRKCPCSKPVNVTPQLISSGCCCKTSPLP